MPHVARRYTVDEVLAFPSDGNRYELVRGELLVSPAPRRAHQYVVGELFALLRAYLAEQAAAARVFLSPADISWAEDLLVQPDVFVVPAEEGAGEWSDIRTLLLAVEVVSPSTARYDRIVKRAAYQEHGVPTYWIVDPDARLVEVWRPDDERPEIVTDTLRWRATPDASELLIPLPEVFEAE